MCKDIFTNISFINAGMSDYLDAPTPYLIGISTSTWNSIWMRKWGELSDDTIAFDLDTGHFMNKSD